MTFFMPDKEEQLKPRFKIEKSRIGGESAKKKSEPEFVPDKVIYVELDEEITSIFDRIKRTPGKILALVIPRRAIALQSVVNLKILKKKIDETGKEIIVVTSDPNGLMLAQKAGINAIEKFFEKSSSTKENQPQQVQQKNERPVRLSGEKVSLSQVIRSNPPSMIPLLIARIKEYLKKRKQAKETRIVFVTPNKQALFTLILVSVLLLLAIAYIALPGATIYLTPKATILDPSFNITFLDYDKNRTYIESDAFNTIVIPTHVVDPPPFTKNIIHSSTGKTSKGTKARGVITIVNLSGAPWELSAQTRFQTDSGLIYRIPDAVRVPAGRLNIPGNLDVTAIADDFDANNQVIGDRGNIGPAKFFLPGIKNPENKKKLYAETKTGMSGGSTQTVKNISKEDVEAAISSAKKEVNVSAVDDLKKYLEQQNLINKTNFSILNDKHAMKISEPVVNVAPDLIGKEADQFEITASYTVSGMSFDREDLISAMRDRLKSRVDPDKRILSISEDDISYKYLDQDDSAGRLRLTATMRAIQVYELDPEKENGHRFIKKITDHILGMSTQEALEYLQQQTDEIARADVTTWPVWAPTIPTLADNIKFVIREENNLQR